MSTLDHLGEEILVGDKVWLHSERFDEKECIARWGMRNPEFVVVEIVNYREGPDSTHPCVIILRSTKTASVVLAWPEEIYVQINHEVW